MASYIGTFFDGGDSGGDFESDSGGDLGRRLGTPIESISEISLATPSGLVTLAKGLNLAQDYSSSFAVRSWAEACKSSRVERKNSQSTFLESHVFVTPVSLKASLLLVHNQRKSHSESGRRARTI